MQLIITHTHVGTIMHALGFICKNTTSQQYCGLAELHPHIMLGRKINELSLDYFGPRDPFLRSPWLLHAPTCSDGRKRLGIGCSPFREKSRIFVSVGEIGSPSTMAAAHGSIIICSKTSGGDPRCICVAWTKCWSSPSEYMDHCLSRHFW